MNEVEALISDALEQHRIDRCIHGVPAHVRQDRCIEFGDSAGPLAEPRCVVTPLDPVLEEHLHADADAQDWPRTRQATTYNLATAHGVQLGDDGLERTHPGHDEAVS
jgi:hypothetical protein